MIDSQKNLTDFLESKNFLQSIFISCKPKMIMSPLSKIEMSPLIAFKGQEVLYGGTKNV